MTAILYAALLSASLPPLAGAKTELEGKWNVKDFELNDTSPKLLRLFHGLSTRTKKKDRVGYLNVMGDRFLPLGRDKLIREANFTLDTTKAPKTIDLSGTDRFLKGTKFLGIYKLEGDTLTICVTAADTRPTEFKAGTGQLLIRYERVKGK